MKCKCNYHLEMGPNLLCPVHGKREDLQRHTKKLEDVCQRRLEIIDRKNNRIKELKAVVKRFQQSETENKAQAKTPIYGRGREKSGGK